MLRNFVFILSSLTLLPKILSIGSNESTHTFDLLAPHERKLYEALNKINQDDGIELQSLHANNAVVELACGKDQVRSGSIHDVLGPILPVVKLVKTKIEPITTTNNVDPAEGIFSFNWITFVSTNEKNGECSAIFSGFATVTFNEVGLVTSHKRFSNNCQEVMDCFFNDTSKFHVLN